MIQAAVKKERKSAFESIGELAANMTSREYAESDYLMAHDWWKSYGRGHIEKTPLPKTGIVVEDNGNPVAVGWIYFSNSEMAQIGWITANPRSGPKKKIAAVVRLFVAAEEQIKKLGFTYLQTMVDNPTLSKIASGLGWELFVKHDFLIKRLGGVEDGDV